ncbi:hypothetical protein A8144_05480 [Mycobacterium leprae 3125609]|uniref:Uncharacterized protein ML0869 n=1 Tax=Mycobacterium leprae (strain TN) TaxID=272631 RepID=Y869_MYCLE|nr:DUF3043 domain-containing protein [Mycobacterium leprae]Q9CCF6.2 RecName: Full=Uncharacterized protein ML0869 [Mycobacterium leprae TN]OAR21566.1 hypothetical protein A8144_05480 [Mycobacterium leprae 3125609]OAX71725.1 hypothetical protein A3216_04200 [Mycobacterium leprae 7935681]
MKLLGRKKSYGQDIETSDDNVGSEASLPDTLSRGSSTTAPKGRPTRKRDDADRRHTKKGPITPAPMTASEARARRKSLAPPKCHRAERRAKRAASKAQITDRRERMMAGEEAYLPPRDQGPVRRYIRDLVDARRNALGLFTPSALVLLFITFGVPQLQLYMSPAMLVLLSVMGIDGIILGRKISKLVDVKFPSNTESHWRLGLYAAGRASQMRRLRVPRPQVEHGSSVG